MKDRDLALGIDIGGTNTSLGFVDHRGKLILSSSMPTRPEDSAEKFMVRLHEEIEKLREGVSFSHRWIGIGVPNVHAFRGTVQTLQTLCVGCIRKITSILVRAELPDKSIVDDIGTAGIRGFHIDDGVGSGHPHRRFPVRGHEKTLASKWPTSLSGRSMLKRPGSTCRMGISNQSVPRGGIFLSTASMTSLRASFAWPIFVRTQARLPAQHRAQEKT